MAPKPGQPPADPADDAELRNEEGDEQDSEGLLEAGEGGEGEPEDAAEDVAEQEADDEEDVAPPRRGRADERIQRLLREREEDRRRLADLEARTRAPAQTGPREETDEEFNARLQLLDPETRVEARLERAERRNQQRLAAMQFQHAEAIDKAGYDAKKAYDQRYQRYEKDVEDLVASQRQQGIFLQREIALAHILGSRMLKRGDKEVDKARDKGRQRIERQRTRPPDNRGDAGRGRERDTGRTARDKRLEDMDI